MPAKAADMLHTFSSAIANSWRSEVVTRIRQNIARGATNEYVTTMHELGGSGAGSWMAFPSEPRHCLTSQEIVIAARLRMHLDVHLKPPAGNIKCAHKGGQRTGFRTCDQHVSEKGLHGLLCKLGGHVIARHDSLRDAIARLISELLEIWECR